MQPDEFRCSKCGKMFSTMNRIIHEVTCKAGEDGFNVIRQSPSHLNNNYDPRVPESPGHSMQGYQSPSSHDPSFLGMFRKPESTSYPKVDKKYRVEELPVDPKDQFGYRCPKCTEFVQTRMFVTHLNQCPYSSCRYCYDYYPNEIFNDHQQFCDKNPNQGVIEDAPDLRNPYFDGNPNSGQGLYRPQNSIRSDNGSQDMSPYDYNHRGSESESSPRVPLSDIYQSPSRSLRSESENPFFVFFRGGPGGSRQRVYQEAPLRPRTQTRLFINGREVDADEFGGGQGGLGDFFQLFMNHGNFMRQNRFTINGQRLADLLEQLSNPNQGVRREDLGKIEVKVFRKAKDVKPGEEEKCSICITEFEDGEEIKNLPCNHMFHGNCIDTWLVQNSHCPICKADLLERGMRGQRQR